MMNKPIRVFSYGSNMPYQRINARISDAKLIGVAFLNDYKLVFNKISKDGSAKANIMSSKGDIVYGVVYEIDAAQKEKLDKFEGKGYGYEDAIISVQYLEGNEEEVLSYMVLEDKYIDNKRLPYHWYKAYVLAGAKEHQLPKDYIERIENIESEEDPNEKRRNEKLEQT